MELFVLIILFGLIIGSFLNCLIWRLYAGETLLGRSYCPHCRVNIGWYDNIPFLSYLILLGKCRHCRKSIHWHYPLVEVLTAGIFALVFYYLSRFNGLAFDWDWTVWLTLARDLFIVCIFLVILIMDMRWYVVSDLVTIPAIVIITVINLLLGYSWSIIGLGALVGGGFFLLQYLISRGRWIGDGDIRIGLLLGVFFGWPMVISSIGLAYGLGAIAGIILLITRKKKAHSMMPLGSFLAIGGIISIFLGEFLVNWYLRLINVL
ncbi:MAG: prepilin peptidase [Patescibacteria group bacterium]|nr:MAG: prepilin peptidase [Patescibacteria group bacterium]